MKRTVSRASLLGLSALLVLAVLAVPKPMAQEPSAESGPEPVSRRLLALYSSRETPRAVDTLIHRSVETVLNHLGMIVDYHDVETGLPTDEQMAAYRGFVTWFQDEKMIAASDYCRWFARQINAGQKAVVLGNLGAFRDEQGQPTPEPLITKAFTAMKLRYGGLWTDNPLVVRLKQHDPTMVEFERSLTDEATVYERIVSLDPTSNIYLTLVRSDIEHSESHPVVTTAVGGFALQAYLLYQHPVTYKRQWRLNPFRFFNEAFDLAALPRMDVTTLNGSRMLYTHIDGDGFRNVSHINTKKLCPEIIRDEILKRYNVPFTVSVIGGEVDPAALGSRWTEAIARSIFALPNVEAASHTFSHPYDWTTNKPGLTGIKGYSDTYQLEKEIDGSVDYINRTLLPKGKQVVLFQWSGHCNPPLKAVERTARLGLLNINGDDSRFDAEFPSVAHISPFRLPGEPVQFNATNANENLYTGLWTGPFFGFRNVMQTWKNTESPRRLRAINVYYHFYSGERQASLTALRQVYDWALAQPVVPIYATDYLKVAQGFFDTTFARGPEGGWVIENNGHCRTVRFDATEAGVDLARSTGVIGYSHLQGSLYVHLDNSATHTVYTTTKKQTIAYLQSADCQVNRLQRSDKSLKLEVVSYRQSNVTVVNLASNTAYAITAKGSGLNQKISLTSSPKGKLIIPVPAGLAVHLSVQPTE